MSRENDPQFKIPNNYVWNCIIALTAIIALITVIALITFSK